MALIKQALPRSFTVQNAGGGRVYGHKPTDDKRKVLEGVRIAPSSAEPPFRTSVAKWFVRRSRWLVARAGPLDVRPSIRLLIAFILTIAAAACGEREAASKVERFANAANQSCFADSGLDRWSPSGTLHLARLAVDSEARFEMGVGGSELGLYLFDYSMGRIVVTDSLGRTTGTFARAGHGPGEILPVGAISRLTPNGRRAAWIDVSHDTVSVLDGMTVHWYRPDGTLIRDARRGLAQAARGSPPLLSSRLRRFGARDLIDIESIALTASEGTERSSGRQFTIWSLGVDDGTSVFRLQLAPLPVMTNGSYYMGPDEAQGVWDLHDECIVASDGGTPRLYVQRVGGGAIDTIEIPLAEPAARGPGEEAELLARMGRGPPPKPTLQKRIRRFKIDPDGWAWIEPAQPASASSGIAVLRVHIASGLARLDTFPAFPLVFRVDGSFVGARPDTATGSVHVLHVRRRR